MTSRNPGRRTHPVVPALVLALLWSQAGCNDQAPAVEPGHRPDAQEKRGVSLKGEASGLRPPAKAVRPGRKR
jgi:hypothetical protein